MPYNGSGTYVPVAAPDFPAVPATTIRSAQYNAQVTDLALALSQCVTRTGESPAQANLPMATYRHTNTGAAQSRLDYARASDVQDGRLQTLTNILGTNILTATLSPAPAGYVVGQQLVLTPVAANTGAVTLNINGAGAKAVLLQGGLCSGGELVQDVPTLVVYNGTNFELQGSRGNIFQRVRNVATLRSIAVTLTRDIGTQGYYTPGDGGHGGYYGVVGAAPGTYTDNGGSVIVPTGGDGSCAWLLKYDLTINVRQWGAKGDGLADDTPPLQTALDAAIGVGVTIHATRGTYKTTTSLNWPQDWPVRFFGDGLEATHINYTGAGNAINMFDAGASTKYVKSSIEHLRLSGNGATSQIGISVRQGYAIALRNARVYNFMVGVRVEQTWSMVLDFVRIDSNSQVGLELRNEANNIACYGCELLDNGTGLYTAGARAVLLSGCTLEVNTAYGAYITANATDGHSENIVFEGCYIEGNVTNDIRVIRDSGAVSPEGVVVRDSYFVGMAAKASLAIRVDQASHVVVDGNDFSVGTVAYAYSLYISDGGAVSGVRWGKNRDTSTNGVYRGTGTSYSDEGKQESSAWGTFTISGGAVTASAGFGFSSVARIAAGVYEVTLRDPAPSLSYAVLANAENGASFVAMLCSPGVPISTSVFRLYTASDAATLADARTVTFSVHT